MRSPEVQSRSPKRFGSRRGKACVSKGTFPDKEDICVHIYIKIRNGIAPNFEISFDTILLHQNVQLTNVIEKSFK